MKTISAGKKKYLDQLTNENGVIGALAIDQRGALKKMIGNYKEATTDDVIKFKELVSQQLTPYASAILLDPEYGLPAAEVRDAQCGLLLAYVLNVWSVRRLKEAGADACKFLLYYDVDEPEEINEQKRAYMERIGSECTAEGIPFFLEIVSYDTEIADATSQEYAQVKPRKVIGAMQEFSQERYQVDVLKVEVPVNMNFVEGFGETICYTQAEAAAYFKEQSDATELPFIFLSAGVSAELFQETLRFAKQSGSAFNGVLCGRATWANGVEPFVKESEEKAIAWLSEQGKQNIIELNEVLKETATSVYTKA